MTAYCNSTESRVLLGLFLGFLLKRHTLTQPRPFSCREKKNLPAPHHTHGPTGLFQLVLHNAEAPWDEVYVEVLNTEALGEHKTPTFPSKGTFPSSAQSYFYSFFYFFVLLDMELAMFTTHQLPTNGKQLKENL